MDDNVTTLLYSKCRVEDTWSLHLLPALLPVTLRTSASHAIREQAEKEARAAEKAREKAEQAARERESAEQRKL